MCSHRFSDLFNCFQHLKNYINKCVIENNKRCIVCSDTRYADLPVPFFPLWCFGWVPFLFASRSLSLSLTHSFSLFLSRYRFWCWQKLGTSIAIFYFICYRYGNGFACVSCFTCKNFFCCKNRAIMSVYRFSDSFCVYILIAYNLWIASNWNQ